MNALVLLPCVVMVMLGCGCDDGGSGASAADAGVDAPRDVPGTTTLVDGGPANRDGNPVDRDGNPVDRDSNPVDRGGSAVDGDGSTDSARPPGRDGGPDALSGSWTGPRVELVDTTGFSRLRIDGKLVVPLFFAANTQGNLQDDWAAFDHELDLAARFGVPIVSITMRNGWEYSASNPLSEQTREVFQRVLDRHPDALILPRVFVHHPAAESVVLRDLGGKEQQHAFNAISEAWISERSAALAALMGHLDAEFPSRILGVHLAYLETGEWFYPGAFVQRFADYSAAAQAGFCDYLGLVAGHEGCQVPAPGLRNSPNVGNVFLEATDADALRSVRFNQYLSHNVARAIGTLAASVKRVSGRKALTVAFYGYTFALGDIRLPGSGHLALGELLDHPDLDAVAAPYQYGEDARQLGGGMLPHGPADSPGLHNKLWIHEDDTRTHLCSDWGAFECYQARDLTQSVFYLRRNALTAGLRGHGLYLFDLLLGGWFGKPDEPTSTDIWLNYSLLRQRVARLDRGGAADLQAEVAVFTDERSAAYLPLAGAAGQGSALNRAFYREPVAALSQIGAPVRHYLLSDLTSPRFRSERVKLAIFPNAFRVDQSMRRTIRERLQGGGRTLVYVYAPGVMDQRERAGLRLARELTGIALEWRLSPGSLSTSLQDAGPISVIRQKAGSRYGPTYGVSPWLYGVDTNATVLGRYFGRGHPALLLKQFSGYRVVFSGSPGLPSSVWRGLAEYAGVHLYTPAVGDVVEAAGNMLMLHGSDAGARTLRLPFSANRVVEDTLGSERVVCTACDHFQTGRMLAGGVLQYWLE